MKLCLNLIVKDEEQVIERCLLSALPYVDYVVISDTGSSDKTLQKIERTLALYPNVALKTSTDTWVNFAHNRTLAIKHAQEFLKENKEDLSKAFLLFIDADEEFVRVDKGDLEEALSYDMILGQIQFSDLSYSRASACRASLPFYYESVIHEYLTCKENFTNCSLPKSLVTKVNTDGARSKDPNKFLKDIEVLEKALLDEPNNPRYVYYLAQSQKDAGQYDLARETYLKRAAMKDTWEEERWHASLRAAQLCLSYEQKTFELLACFEKRPSRVESLVALFRLLNLGQMFNTVVALSSTALSLADKGTTDKLFIEVECYTWRTHDEVALALYYSGKVKEARLLWEKVFSVCPLSEKPRILENIKWCD